MSVSIRHGGKAIVATPKTSTILLKRTVTKGEGEQTKYGRQRGRRPVLWLLRFRSASRYSLGSVTRSKHVGKISRKKLMFYLARADHPKRAHFSTGRGPLERQGSGEYSNASTLRTPRPWSPCPRSPHACPEPGRYPAVVQRIRRESTRPSRTLNQQKRHGTKWYRTSGA